MPDKPWTVQTDGINLDVRLTPKAGRNALTGIDKREGARPALRAAVRSAPEDGKANAALIELLSDELRVPAGSIALKSGGKSRTKTLSVTGDPATLVAKLETILSRPDGKKRGQTRDQ